MSTLIIGAGIVGLTVARELVRRGADDILILEKEDTVGAHASGRNSGVLHAGIYYTPDSFKARFCVEGNRLMKAYCREKGLPLLECGKVIVTKTPEELERLYELQSRAESAGVEVKIIDEKELHELEPYARTVEKALYSPETAVVEPRKVLKALVEELSNTGKVRFLFNTRALKPMRSGELLTSRGTVKYSVLLNAAGAYSDRIAHAFGIGLNYRLIPFKGLYRKLHPEKKHLVRGNIYPVPDLVNPFLGVHFTPSADGNVYAGPTATPALGRENYGLLKGMNGEFLSIAWRDALLFLSNPAFRAVASREAGRYLLSGLYRDARALVPSLQRGDLLKSSKVGIRAQLVDWKEKKLIMDFIVLKGEKSVHVLNAVSPAFTSSMSFARYVADLMQEV